MSRIDLSTAGVRLYYGVAGVGGVKPASWEDFTAIAGIKEIPEMNPAPDTIESTTLDEEEYKTYVDGLKDFGGSLGFTFNLTQAFIDAWEDMLDAYDAATDGMWFAVDVPGITKVFYFPGNPAPVGLNGVSVNTILEVTGYITPVGEAEWDDAPANIDFAEFPVISITDNVIEWAEVTDATQYKVYKSATSGGTRTLIGITSDLYFNLALLVDSYITVDACARHYNDETSNEVLYDVA
jgi:hypothetical protein